VPLSVARLPQELDLDLDQLAISSFGDQESSDGPVPPSSSAAPASASVRTTRTLPDNLSGHMEDTHFR
jgi:hypothetical protein